MRKSKKETAKSKAKILRTAARLLRERGIEGASIADVMVAAGMTQGGFYRHFSSKDDMLAQATRQAFSEMTARFDRAETRERPNAALRAYAADYLSSQHIDHPGRGCPVAGYGSDAARIANVLGPEFAHGAEELIARTTRGLAARGRTPKEARAEAIRLLTMLVGTVVISRAAGNSRLREEIVRASKALLNSDE